MPTHVSMRRSQLLRKSSAEKRMILFDSSSCGRHHGGGGGAYKVDIRFAARAKRWWTETAKFVKLLKSHLDTEHLTNHDATRGTDGSAVDESGAEDADDETATDNTELLYRAVRTARLPPLQLERSAGAPRLDQLTITKKRSKIRDANKRDTYPLSTGRVEFKEYRGLSKCL